MPQQANLTTTTQVDPGVQVYYDRVLLKRAVPFLIFERFAQTRNISRKSGDTIKFRRYASLSPATTPLSEGVTPPGSQASKTDLTARVKQFGDFLHLSDWVDLTVEDAVLTEFAELNGEQMGETRDTLCRDIIMACASTITCGAQLDTAHLDAAIQALASGDAKMLTSMLRAGTGQGTVPISPCYVGMGHTDLWSRLKDITDWVPVREYSKPNEAMEGEWGSYQHIRFLLSSRGDKTEASPDNYDIPIVGKNAYAVTEIEGGAARNIVKAFGSGGTSDPLDQRGTSGWKMTYAARILNDNFMVKIDSAQL